MPSLLSVLGRIAGAVALTAAAATSALGQDRYPSQVVQIVVPYAPAVVSLDEGWWFLSSVVGCAPGDLREGLALQVEFHPASDELTLPYFRPVGSH